MFGRVGRRKEKDMTDEEKQKIISLFKKYSFVGETKTMHNEVPGSGTEETILITKEDAERAIEIVKQGGVGTDVCEWIVFDNSIEDDDHIWTFETGCKNYIEEENTLHFDYCPYCGKKIKVV